MFLFFFFKQKTAYEMRISDWTSDVCSSDLRIRTVSTVAPRPRFRAPPVRAPGNGEATAHARHHQRRRCRAGSSRRSEEHTSELQSLMRISYAVFCLKKKKLTYTFYLRLHLNPLSHTHACPIIMLCLR